MEGSECMSIMRRKKVFGMVAVILAGGLIAGSMARASSEKRRDGISSSGAVNYNHGAVVIDSADLIALADEMDALESSFKTDIADALTKIGTYMQQDGSISYESKADINPRRITFRDFETGILKSQSVDYLASTHASDTKGPVYYKFDTKNLLEVTADDTGMPVLILPATEDNLTLQTAAWVDGHSFVGNGSDNYYFYQKGFIEGYANRMGATVEYQYDDTGKIVSANLVFP